jgi:PAS domain S-box-containing protein
MSDTAKTANAGGDRLRLNLPEQGDPRAALINAATLRQAIHNNASFSSITTNAKGIIQIFSLGAEKLLGYSAVEVLNKFTPVDLHDKDELATRAIALSKEFGVPIPSGFQTLAFKAARGQDDTYEITKIRKDGSRFPAQVSISALRDNQNLIIGYLLVATDNSAQRAVQANLRVSEIRYRRLFETAHDGVLLVDANTKKITDANPFMTALLGYTREQFIGRELFEIGLFKDEIASQDMMLKLEATGQVRYEDLPLKSITGKQQEVEVVANLYDEDGKAVIQCNIRDITQRKKTETQLHDANAVFENIFSSNMIAMGLWSVDGTIQNANNALLNLLGYSRQDFIDGKISWLTFTPEKYSHLDQAAIAVIDAYGSCDPYEKEYVTKSGDRIPVLVGGARLDRNSKIGSFFAIDLRERKRSENALRDSQSKLNLGVKVAGIGLGSMNYEDDTITLDNIAAALFALPANVPVARNDVHARFHPDDTKKIMAMMARCLDPAGDGFMALEHRIVRPDGSVRWVSARKKVAFKLQHDDTRVPKSGLLALLDINERVVANQLLHDSEQRVHVATEATQVGIWEWNILTGKIRWDAQMFRIYGIAPTEDGFVYYARWRECVLPEDQIQQEALLQDVVSHQGQSTREFRICTQADNKIRTIQAVDTARVNDQGIVEWVVGTNLDITDRKQAQIDLQNAMQNAEQANLAKSNFLSSMSHELRSPLHAILGFTQLIETGIPSPTSSQRNSLEQILHAGWYLLDLINEVLDLAMIESGKISLSKELISLTELLSECESMIEPQALKSGVRVVFPRSKTDHVVNADRTRLKQVFINLLSNAIKYNRVGGTVTVTCSLTSDGKTLISFHDTGEGLSPEKLSQLFEPFNRLGQDASSTEGTGIGLALSQRLMHLMDGQIGAQSQVGVGSSFWVELDSAIPAIGSSKLANQPNAPRTMPAPLRAPASDLLHHVLCVEDNPANLSFMENLLSRRSDVRLSTASEANEAIAIARSLQPDVILMDINLPGMSGTKAMNILKSNLATTHIPVIAISARAMPLDIENGIAAGFFLYLTKPIKIPEFLAALDLALTFARTTSTRKELWKQQ